MNDTLQAPAELLSTAVAGGDADPYLLPSPARNRSGTVSPGLLRRAPPRRCEPRPARQPLPARIRRPHDAALGKEVRSPSTAACATGCCSRPPDHTPARPGGRPSRRAGSRTCARASRRSSMPRSTASPRPHGPDRRFAFRLPVTGDLRDAGHSQGGARGLPHGCAHRRAAARSRAALPRRDRRGQRRQPDAGRVFPLAVRAAPASAGRGPDQPAGAGRGGRQQALQRGADRQHYSPVRRRPRDHGQPDRQRPPGARPQPRPARAVAERSLAVVNAIGGSARDPRYGSQGRTLGTSRSAAPDQGNRSCACRRRQPRPAVYPDRPARHHPSQHPPCRSAAAFTSARRPSRAHRGRSPYRRCCAASRS